jgi:hypothetical protein
LEENIMTRAIDEVFFELENLSTSFRQTLADFKGAYTAALAKATTRGELDLVSLQANAAADLVWKRTELAAKALEAEIYALARGEAMLDRARSTMKH